MTMPAKKVAKKQIRKGKLTLEEQIRQKHRQQAGQRKKEIETAFRILREKMPKAMENVRKRQAQGKWVEPCHLRLPNIVKFGKNFMLSFPFEIVGRKTNKFAIRMGGLGHEAPVVIGVCPLKAAVEGKGYYRNIVELNLGFERDAIVVESIQGKEGKQASLDRFRQAVGKPAVNSLLELVERHARRCGFKKAKIIRPENLFSYRFPELLEIKPDAKMTRYLLQWHIGKLMEFEGRIGKKVREIREQMQRLYGAVAQNCGYRIEGNYFVKDL